MWVAASKELSRNRTAKLYLRVPMSKSGCLTTFVTLRSWELKRPLEKWNWGLKDPLKSEIEIWKILLKSESGIWKIHLKSENVSKPGKADSRPRSACSTHRTSRSDPSPWRMCSNFLYLMFEKQELLTWSAPEGGRLWGWCCSRWGKPRLCRSSKDSPEEERVDTSNQMNRLTQVVKWKSWHKLSRANSPPANDLSLEDGAHVRPFSKLGLPSFRPHLEHRCKVKYEIQQQGFILLIWQTTMRQKVWET